MVHLFDMRILSQAASKCANLLISSGEFGCLGIRKLNKERYKNKNQLTLESSPILHIILVHDVINVL